MEPVQTKAVRPLEVLLVEDSLGDVGLIEAAFRRTGLPYRLHVVGHGKAAMAFLRREDRYVQAVRPDLILLDLNLPGMDGRRVLLEVKADPSLRRIPIVILTSSNAESDIAQAYDLHANSYVVKPPKAGQILEVIRSLHSYWAGTVVLPPKSPSETEAED